jgi:hypothetical protein
MFLKGYLLNPDMTFPLAGLVKIYTQELEANRASLSGGVTMSRRLSVSIEGALRIIKTYVLRQDYSVTRCARENHSVRTTWIE